MADIEQLRQKVKNREEILIAGLGGGESALKEKALKLLRRDLVEISEPELNHQKFTIPENSIGECLGAANTSPFLSKWRMVEINQVEKISSAELKILLDYIESPMPSTILILKFEKADRKNKLVKHLVEKEFMYFFEPLTIDETIAHVEIIFKENNLQIDHDAKKFLCAFLNQDIAAIESGAKKLALLKKNCEINVDDILENLTSNEMQNAFHLASLIGEGRIQEALLDLQKLKVQNENAIKFMGVLIWHFKNIIQLRECLDRGLNDWDIRKEISVFGERYSRLKSLAQIKTINFHIGRMLKLVDVDRALKSFRATQPFNHIEKFIYQCAVGIKNN